MNSNSEVEFDSSDDDLSSNVQHSKRPFTRPFVHLKKRLRGAPCKSKYKALKAAGRVRDLCFTKRYSNADIKGMLKSNFQVWLVWMSPSKCSFVVCALTASSSSILLSFQANHAVLFLPKD